MPEPTDLAWLRRLELSEADDSGRVCAEASRRLAELDPIADETAVRRLELVLAIGAARSGQVEHGVSAIRGIRSWAIAQTHDPVQGHGPLEGAQYVEARCERLLGALLRRAGEAATSLEHAVAAVNRLPTGTHPSVRADHLIGLADSLAVCGSAEESLARYEEARAFAELADDELMMTLVLNNLAYTLYEAGRSEEGQPYCETLVAQAAAAGRPLPLYALDTVANTYLAVGRADDAEVLLDRVQRVDDARGEDVAECQLTLARVRRARGDLDGAQQALDRCRRSCAEFDLGETDVRALCEQAELDADCGRFDLAFARYKEYHERYLAQRAVEREASARMMQAIFEASQARRESARFREMSYRDALTALRNRRYVDDHLTELLDRLLGGGAEVFVAFIDLDHFKRVNDTCSHEVGDEVLRRVAQLLETSVETLPEAIAARMGGEEFLIVLPGLGSVRAAEILESVRADIEHLEWAGLTADLPVTVSLGCACAPHDGSDRLSLLAAADRRLYAAKAAGRNRLVWSDDVASVGPEPESA